MNEPKSKEHTASIFEGTYCKDCGWPLISACCNDEMADLYPHEDWLIYCANKGCKNHEGQPDGPGYEVTFLARTQQKQISK